MMNELITDASASRAERILSGARRAFAREGHKSTVTAEQAGLFQYLAAFCLTLAERVEALEQREANLKYCGVWTSGKTYQKGNFATHAGSIWHCDEPTNEAPGRSNAWTLAAKGGGRGKA